VRSYVPIWPVTSCKWCHTYPSQWSVIHNRPCTTVFPIPLIKCCTIPPLANSDHNGIVTTVKWNPVTAPTQRRRTIWRYAYADWDKAKELISQRIWDLLLTDDVNDSWSNWHKEFLSIIDQCIPRKVLPPGKNLPWMSKCLRRAMKKRNAKFKYGKRTDDYSQFS